MVLMSALRKHMTVVRMQNVPIQYRRLLALVDKEIVTLSHARLLSKLALAEL